MVVLSGVFSAATLTGLFKDSDLAIGADDPN
jgi:hypothetical protein